VIILSFSGCSESKIYTYTSWTPDAEWRPLLGDETVIAADVSSSVPFTLNGKQSVLPSQFEYYEEVNSLDSRIDDIHHFFAAARTKEELTALQSQLDALHELTCDEWLHSVGWCDFPFPNLHDRYDDEYFNNNILILWYVSEGSSAYINWVSTIEVENDTLVVNVNRYSPSGPVTDDIATFGGEIQIKKADFTASNTVLKVTKVIRPPNCITIDVKDDYFDKVKDESFTTKDFRHENIAGVRYLVWEYPQARFAYIYVYLNQIGTVRAAEMADYFKSLSFTEEVIIGAW
jgi:hypothetical protein